LYAGLRWDPVNLRDPTGRCYEPREGYLTTLDPEERARVEAAADAACAATGGVIVAAFVPDEYDYALVAAFGPTALAEPSLAGEALLLSAFAVNAVAKVGRKLWKAIDVGEDLRHVADDIHLTVDDLPDSMRPNFDVPALKREQRRGPGGKFIARAAGEGRAGTSFESEVKSVLEEYADPGTVTGQISVRTGPFGGIPLTTDNAVKLEGVEYLFDAKAGMGDLSKPQKAGFPLIRKEGAVVTSSKYAKEGFPKGTRIRPHGVRAVREGDDGLEKLRTLLARWRRMKGG
jgi:hypothetical protein